MDRKHALGIGRRRSTLSWPIALAWLLVLGTSSSAIAQETIEVNYLTLGAGAVVVKAGPAAERGAEVAIDGSEQTLGIGAAKATPLPLSFVIELPADTTFERFQTPVFTESGSAKGRHIRTIRIEGSATGPDSGFELLVEARLAEGAKAPQRFPVAKPRAVRWVRVTFVDRHQPVLQGFEHHNFTELEGYGQQARMSSTGSPFTGRWRYRRKGINDAPGLNIIDLIQKGGQVNGCQRMGGRFEQLSGSVEGGLLRLVAETDKGVKRPFTAVVTRDGNLSGVSFDGPARAFYASPDSAADAPCPPPRVANPVEAALGAGGTAVLYGIHFDVNSDRIRPDAEPALKELLSALENVGKLSVTVEGHTDHDGSDADNQGLSERRAKAVVKWLVERGIAATRLQPSGKGESEPIADNATSAGRALNRRVQVVPTR